MPSERACVGRCVGGLDGVPEAHASPAFFENCRDDAIRDFEACRKAEPVATKSFSQFFGIRSSFQLHFFEQFSLQDSGLGEFIFK